MTKKIIHIKSINQLHKLLDYKPTKHPLVTLIKYDDIDFSIIPENTKVILDFYAISLKSMSSGVLKYGRQHIDFDEASMICTSPGQVVSVNEPDDDWKVKGWGLYFHPDLIRNSFLGEKINDYRFFSYQEHEALHVSEAENQVLKNVLQTIKQEYSLNLDVFSTDLIISNIEVLLNYCKRFYGRQFITRQAFHSDFVSRFEKLIKTYFDNQMTLEKGLPSVKYCAEQLALSPNYLSDLLKQETGKTTQEHIHFHLIEKAKDKLLNTNETINEIAYGLGFEQAQNFSRLFKRKTGESPKVFRQAYN
jgi:AraC-like DNA-binding protein